MTRLTKKQSKLLKKINAQKINFQAMSETDKQICSYLQSLGYIDVESEAKIESYPNMLHMRLENMHAEINERGETYLANEHIDKFKISIPDIVGWVLSGITLVLSTIALLKP